MCDSALWVLGGEGLLKPKYVLHCAHAAMCLIYSDVLF